MPEEFSNVATLEKTVRQREGHDMMMKLLRHGCTVVLKLARRGTAERLQVRGVHFLVQRWGLVRAPVMNSALRYYGSQYINR